jgi:hypothetical protein
MIRLIPGGGLPGLLFPVCLSQVLLDFSQAIQHHGALFFQAVDLAGPAGNYELFRNEL